MDSPPLNRWEPSLAIFAYKVLSFQKLSKKHSLKIQELNKHTIPVKTFSELIQWELENAKLPSSPENDEDDSSSTGVARSIRQRVKFLARQREMDITARQNP
ncbi:MAG: hypothetical protein JWM99_1033 [Verrucomicrobiales bacterium]|nr:hypothetical protein [Verrucomicrobiales bacterium]